MSHCLPYPLFVQPNLQYFESCKRKIGHMRGSNSGVPPLSVPFISVNSLKIYRNLLRVGTLRPNNEDDEDDNDVDEDDDNNDDDDDDDNDDDGCDDNISHTDQPKTHKQ
jgi:hypothetical protein